MSGVRMRGDTGPCGAAGGVPRGRIGSNGAPVWLISVLDIYRLSLVCVVFSTLLEWRCAAPRVVEKSKRRTSHVMADTGHERLP